MLETLLGTRLIAHQQLGARDKVKRDSFRLETLDRPFDVDLYRPKGAGNGRLIMFVHGMTVRGHRDDRVLDFCSALACLGFRVAVPLFELIRDLYIDPRQIDECAATLLALADSEQLCPHRRLGLMAPSFSGNIAMIAATRPEVVNRVSSICTIGSYANIDTALEFLLEAEHADEYGKLITLWNFIEHGIGRKKRVIEGFRIAALDNGHRRENTAEAGLPPYLETLRARERALFQELRHDRVARLAAWAKAYRTRPLQEIVSAFDLMPRLNQVKCPVTLVHGRDDDVIPATESELLYEKLVRNGTPAKLCLTQLISHGDAEVGPSMLPDALRLAGSFGYFLKHV